MSNEDGERVQRRLAAILVAAYSRLSPGDEKASFAELRFFLSGVIRPQIAEFGGNIFKEAAELVLAEFDSVTKAVRCAAGLRDEIARRNEKLPEGERLVIRIGINFGDIIAEEGDIFGDGVNIAARVGTLAKPGSIYISEIVRSEMADELDFDFEDLGPQELKNIARPIRVYRVADGLAKRSEELVAAAMLPASMEGFDNRHAIAVLPFTNFSGDPEQEFFADGITEDIISMLAGWRAFPVIARASTFSYKGQTVDIKKVGEELGVRYVLEGSVRKSGRRVRVTVQLIRADTNHHIMAERYDRNLTDLFDLQDEIAHTIAGAIEPEILKFERDRIADRPQHSEDAYELYQRGMFHHYRQNKQDNLEAQGYFRRALAIDAQYPQAVAALAIAVLNAGYLGWSGNAERNFAEALELAQRATALDPRYPNAHLALALVSMWLGRNDRAAAEFKEAIKLNPSFAAAHAVLGAVLNFQGQSEEGVESVEKGIRLSPSDSRLFIWLSGLAAAHYQLRHYSEAIEIARRSWSLNNSYITGLTYVVAGLAQLGRVEHAHAALADLKKRDPNLTALRTTVQLYQDPAAVDHLLDGLRKAGFE